MSEDKQDARQALLGELESIKSLLSEEEWDHIPLLNDPITTPAPTVDEAREELDFAEDDIPLLETLYHLDTDSIEAPEPSTDALSAPALTQEVVDLHEAVEPQDPVEPEITLETPEAAEPQPSLTAAAAPIPPSQRQYRASKRPVVEPRGENPFLPPHIRERLHTHKTLVDIIKESPPQPLRPSREATIERVAENEQDKGAHEKLPPVLAQEKIHHLVDGIIAIYLPKIEAELRTQLLEALQDNKPAED